MPGSIGRDTLNLGDWFKMNYGAELDEKRGGEDEGEHERTDVCIETCRNMMFY